MSAQSGFNTRGYGDDDFAPDARSWYALALTVAFWSSIFTVVYFATRDVAIEDSVAANGYILSLFITFVLIIFFVIPIFTLFFSRTVDDVTSGRSAGSTAARLAMWGAIAGVIPAAFIFFINTAYGWLPFTQFIIPSLLASALSRLVVDYTLRHAALKFAVIVFTTMVVVGSLGIGVMVLTGRI